MKKIFRLESTAFHKSDEHNPSAGPDPLAHSEHLVSELNQLNPPVHISLSPHTEHHFSGTNPPTSCSTSILTTNSSVTANTSPTERTPGSTPS